MPVEAVLPKLAPKVDGPGAAPSHEKPGRLALLLPKAEPVDAAGETNDDPELAMLPRPKLVPTLVARPELKAGADEAGDKLCAPKGKETPGRLALLLPNKAEPVDAAGETNDDPELAMLPRPKLVPTLVARPKLKAGADEAGDKLFAPKGIEKEKPGQLALLLPKAEPVDAAGKEKPGRLALLLPKAEPVEKEKPGRLALLLPKAEPVEKETPGPPGRLALLLPKAEPVDAAGETNDDPELAMLPRPKLVGALVARPKS
jgi:hypothetical protein